MLRGEQTLGVLVPPDEYEVFCAWRDRQERRAPSQPMHEQFEREVGAFKRMLPELLEQYRGRVIAIHGGQVVEVGAPGETVAEIAGRVHDRIGYVPVYVQEVEQIPRFRRISGPRIAQT